VVFPRDGSIIGRRLVALAVALAAAIAGLMTVGVAGASARARSHQPPVVSPRFRYVAGAVPGSGTPFLWTGVRYALTWTLLSGSSTPATLIDDQTGRRTTIGRAGCHPFDGPEPLDLPWITFSCAPANQPPAWEVYSPATGRWQSVSPSPGVLCSAGCETYLLAAGRSWLEFQQATCTANYHAPCSARNLFQNIWTGAVREDPSGPITMVDLNSPNLTRTVCRPLSVPGNGSLTFHGNFALSSLTDNKLNTTVYLERCGTRLHRLVAPANTYVGGALTGINAHEVLWMAHPGPLLTGLTLPGLKRFTIRLPQRLLGSSCTSPDDYRDCMSMIALTNKRLYILTASYPSQVWAAPAPLPAKAQHK
jgi:hypothetical protein